MLIVYDPDPFYNLDEKLCRAFAKGLAKNDINVPLDIDQVLLIVARASER